MVIDTSAVLAWLKQEPERGRIVAALEGHPICRISAVSVLRRPTAATTTSAWRVCTARSGVALWQIVTVALACNSSSAIGLPTVLLRPMTTACLPRRSTPVDSISFMQP